MNILPVVVIPHRDGPEVWSERIDAAAEVAEEGHGGTWMLRIPGSVVEWARTEKSSQLASLESVGWIAGGWSDPRLGSLPPGLVTLSVERERQAYLDSGIEPTGLWMGDDWDPEIPRVADSLGIDLLFVDSARFATPPQGPVAVDRHGIVVIVVPIADTAFPGLTARVVGPSEVAALLPRSPNSITDIVPGGGRAKLTSPDIERSHDLEVLHRKMLRIANRLPERLRPELVDPVLSAIGAGNLDGGNGLREAHTSLLEVRRKLDHDLLRGDGWSRIRRRDWDADGLEEIVAETPDFSTVIDADAGSIVCLDYKPEGWSVFAMANEDEAEPDSALLRTFEGKTPARTTDWEISEVHERRGVASATLHTDDESVSLEITFDRGRVEMVYTFDDLATHRVGPEFRLALDPTTPEIRVDGSDWISLSETMSRSGHRFRMRDGTRTLLLSSARPMDLFIRPTNDGVVAWANWLTSGTGTYPLTIDLR